MRPGWNETASADNAAAVATRAAETGKYHVVTGVQASFTSTASGLLQVKDGTTVIWQQVVYDHVELTDLQGLVGSRGAAVSATLAASGAGGNLGYVDLQGYTH